MDGRGDSRTLGNVRRALLWTLLAGLAGTGVELILLGHVEGAAQYIPLVLIAVALVCGAWHAVRPSRASVTALQAVMVLCLAAGGVGIGLHYRGNLEFELEMYPEMSGAELIQKVATGATPVLAPGTMSLLGVIGLLHTYRHPVGIHAGRLEEDPS